MWPSHKKINSMNPHKFGIVPHNTFCDSDMESITLFFDSIPLNWINPKINWTFTDPDLFSAKISGAYRLPNGNTLICYPVQMDNNLDKMKILAIEILNRLGKVMVHYDHIHDI